MYFLRRPDFEHFLNKSCLKVSDNVISSVLEIELKDHRQDKE